MLSILLLTVLAQQVEAPSPVPEPRTSLVVAAAWCVVRVDDTPNPGCDVGVGVSLIRHKRLSWVVAIGSSTVGTGVAWIIGRSELGVLAVSVGVIAEYDDQGVNGQQLYPAIGATLSFAKGGQ